MAITNNISGVIFDFDGVVVDSERHWADIENAYLREHLPAWKDQYYKNLIGKSLPEVHEYLKCNCGFTLSAGQYFEDYESMAIPLYRERAKLLPDLSRLLEYLQGHSLLLAIASSSKRSWIDLALEANGLGGQFDVIVSAHDKGIQKGKPAPDVYIAAAKLLGCIPAELIAVEDSRSGILSAKAAGLICVGLRNGFNDDQDLSSADYIADGHTGVLKIIKGEITK
jgi:HAD superfamily hydrolase (TIGR01509 family)